MTENVDNIKYLDISKDNLLLKSRKLIKHIYYIRDLLSDSDIILLSIMVNKKLLDFINKYNFVSLKKDKNIYENNELVGYLMNIKIIYSSDIDDDIIIFNTSENINTLSIKIKF